jgi:fucose permease
MRQRERSFLLIGLAYVSFVSLGLPDGLLGIAWPSVRAFFQLPLDALGALLMMFTTGYLLSSCSSGWLLERLNVGALLALSCLATALSLLGYALAPWWWCMVALGTLSGLGAGAIDAGLNTFAATHFSPRLVNWLHACYGIGASSGPVLMTSVLNMQRPWQWGYGIVGLGQLLLAACFVLTRKWWPAVRPMPEAATGQLPSRWSTLRLPVVWLSIAVFFVYTGLEAAAGAWTYSLFTEARSVSTMTAGMWVSVYWGALMIGRLLAGVAVHVVPVPRLLRLCLFHLVLGAALLWLNPASTLSFLGLALMGLACAPIFPSLIATTPERLGVTHTASGVGWQIAAAVLGQSLLPSLMGVLARHQGLKIVGPGLLAMAVGLLVLYEILMRVEVVGQRRYACMRQPC